MIRKIIISVIFIVILGVGYYLISPLFRTIKLNESIPEMSVVSENKVYPVVGTSGHSASGDVRIVDTKNGKVIRYENFKTINGPDLYVYIAKDLDAKEYVNLGRLRATEGSVNYEIPQGVNLAEYKYVMTWCKRFGVLFNYADLSLQY